MPLCIVRGSVNCDEYFQVKQIGKPGQTISSRSYSKNVGGKGANQALAAARAARSNTTDVEFWGAVGNDGLWLRDSLKDWGVGVSELAVLVDVPTGRALIQVADDGENAILLFPGANFDESRENNTSDIASYFPAETTHLILQNEITMRSTLFALDAAKQGGHNITTVFNPSPMPSPDQLRAFPWAKVDWLLINEGEGEELCALLSSARAAKSSSDVLASLVGLPAFAHTNIICTLGGDGLVAAVRTANGERTVIRLPASKLQGDIRDTTGAGDTFTGYFVRGLMEGDNFEICLKRAIQAAGMCVERRGTVASIPLRRDVDARLPSS
ncbi:Ribokinase-like protein [Fistulina hepatica ATCC 64428]|uniref:Ribokinase n=1 Tax=Fistulina hepatica ATCC 64428 TaxID=1128425 RepID=A0A0D7AML8_9AGAR|nr:Ribokinase-like protein [Fistulina hepatica ATCC 64428]